MVLDLSIAALSPEVRSHLRLVEPRDAHLICELRSNPTLNRFLSPSLNEISKQREWIEVYKEREATDSEYYFVIVCDDNDCGVVRLYDFRDASFSWGSWIIRPPRPRGLVTFSAIMVYEIGFDALGFAHCHFDIRKDNATVIAFHERAGAERVGETDRDYLFSFTPSAYRKFRLASSVQIALHRQPAAHRATRSLPDY